MADTLKVAVRVRPFNPREVDLRSKLCVHMRGQSTYVTDPETGTEKGFSFDHSFWSHSDDNRDSHFVDQKEVFDHLGQMVLENSFEGYNCTILAYGQTGSGKSHTMVGDDNSAVNYSSANNEGMGLIPRLCEKIFQRIDNNTDSNVTFNVEASMMEIYNERLQDLLQPSQQTLKVRESPSIGPYVEGLSTSAVGSYTDLSDIMSQGTRNRTIGATSMNHQSSRAHTIVTIILTQTTMDRERMTAMDKVSRINLVDLAGSERQKKAASSGDRLKEGAAINVSLTTLGKCISAIAKGDSGGDSRGFIPFRESNLTWLLSESLGGNAKTIMVATISPADYNFAETMSTLRYAWQAKQIKTNAVVNEDANDRLIRELREEIELLRAKLSGEDLTDLLKGKNDGKLNDELQKKEEMIANLNKTWEQRLKETQSKLQIEATGGAILASAMHDGTAYLLNLHEDNTMTKKIAYAIQRHTLLGTSPSSSLPGGRMATDEVFQGTVTGVGIQPNHLLVEASGSSGLTLTALEKARVTVNGSPVAENKSMPLSHGDRVILGMNHVFVVCDSYEGTGSLGHLEWAMAMEEVLSGFQQQFFDPAKQAKTEQEMEAKMAAIYAKERALEEEKLKYQNLLMDIEAQNKAMDRKMKRGVDNEVAALKDKLRKERRLGDFEEEKDKLVRRLTNQDAMDRAAMQEKKQEYLSMRDNIDVQLQEQKEKTAKFKLAKEREMQEVARAEEDIMQLIPCVDEATTMAQDMKKPVKYEVRLQSSVSPEVFEDPETGKTMHKSHVEAGVSVHEMHTGNKVIWSYDKFMSRLFLMRDVYQSWVLDKSIIVDPDNDPFVGGDEEVEIGKAHLWLMGLQHMIDVEDSVPIISNLGSNEGKLSVRVMFANSRGEPDSSQVAQADSMADMYGQNINLCIELLGCKGVDRAKYSDVFARFKFFDDDDHIETDPLPMSRSDFKFRHHVYLERINHDFITFLENETLSVEVWGIVSSAEPNDDIAPLNSYKGGRSGGSAGSRGRSGSMNRQQQSKSLTRQQSKNLSGSRKSSQAPELQRKVSRLEEQTAQDSNELELLRRQLEDMNRQKQDLEDELRSWKSASGREAQLESHVAALKEENERLRDELAGRSLRPDRGSSSRSRSASDASWSPGRQPSMGAGSAASRPRPKNPLGQQPSKKGSMASAALAARDPYGGKKTPRQTSFQQVQRMQQKR